MIPTKPPDGTALQRYLAGLVRQGMRDKDWTGVTLAARADISEKHLSQMLNSRAEGSLEVWDRLLMLTGVHPAVTWVPPEETPT